MLRTEFADGWLLPRAASPETWGNQFPTLASSVLLRPYPFLHAHRRFIQRSIVGRLSDTRHSESRSHSSDLGKVSGMKDTEEIPEHFNFAEDVVDHWARETTHRAMIAISQDQQRRDLTFHHFSRKSHQAALFLQSLGIVKGDVVMMVLPRTPEWWEIFVGIVRLGAVPAPCTTLLVTKDLEYRANAANARLFIGDAAALSKFHACTSRPAGIKTISLFGTGSDTASFASDYHAGIAKFDGQSFPSIKTRATDDGLLYFTSGTTGNPKIVIHNQVSYGLGHKMTTGKYWLQLTAESVYWNLSEQGWAKAGWSVCAAWSNGSTLFVKDMRGAFDPIEVLDTLHRYEITTLCAPPTAYRPMTSLDAITHLKKFPFKSLTHCVGAGEPLNPEVIRVWREGTGMEIRDGYGQTETVMLCGNGKGVQVRPGSMGKASPGITLSVLDPRGNEVLEEEGDIGVLTAHHSRRHDHFIFAGYRAQSSPAAPPHTALARRPQRDSIVRPERQGRDGKRWYLTGDRAIKDRDGYFWFIGRNDDVINSSGYRIGPFEVESALKSHPAVLESAVVGSPDPQRSEIVKAFVVLTKEYNRLGDVIQSTADDRTASLVKELQDHVKRVAAPYKYPREIEFRQELPKTVSGKIKRVDLRLEERRKKAANKANL